MKTPLTVISVSTLLLAVVPFQAYAQKGMGDAKGIARQAEKPEIVTLSGTVLEVKTDRCKLATGRSDLGTHVLLKTPDGEELNIHLGPKDDVVHIATQLETNQPLTVTGFRTAKMPENNYIAQTLTLDDKTLQVRDENLRPLWAGGAATRAGRGGSQWGAANRRGQGRGRGFGQGMGNGQGRGQGRGTAMRNGQGRGQGWGMGNGQGRGQGRGAGMRNGQGRGRGMAQAQAQAQGQGRGQGWGQGWGAQQGRGQGPRCRSDRGDRCEQQMLQAVNAFEKGELNSEERNGLLLMREEEKLAHDVYVTLGKKWSLRPLANIPRAESRHMEAIKMLLDRYDLEDPITDMTVGKFPSETMQKLYDDLVEQGEQSIEGAIKVGALIEELDIADLRKMIEVTNNDDIKVVYQNLLKGSRNHLRAFTRQLARYDVTYQTMHLNQEEFDRIANSDHERGVMISDPNFRF